jgi:hypothetical protein
MATTVKCPNCQTDVVWGEQSEHRPFCSKRCQLIDLGEWASESNRIAESPQVSAISEADLDRIENMLAQQDNEFFKH